MSISLNSEHLRSIKLSGAIATYPFLEKAFSGPPGCHQCPVLENTMHVFPRCTGR